MIKSVFPAAVCLAALLCARCGDGGKETGAGLGEPCVEVDCLDGLVCYQDVCRQACSPSQPCPSGDERCQDGACVPVSASCGDGVVDPPLETCDGNCPTTCDDADACTSDVMTGSASACNVRCTSTPVTACAGGDGCCPDGCDASGDGDCPEECIWSSCTSVLPDYNLRHNYVATDLPDGEWNFGTPGLADIDGDGDLDFFVGVSYGAVHWFEYEGRRTGWTRHTVGPLEQQQLGSTVLDVDGDGRVDLVIGGAWYRNPPDPVSQEFTRHVYDSLDASIHDIVAADIDGDGDMEVVHFSPDLELAWFDIPEDPTQEWTRHVIADESVSAGIHGGMAPGGFGDLDGDGDVDLVLCRYWFRNDGNGASWTRFDLPFGRNGTYGDGSPYGYSSRSWVADMDGDGDNDIVETDCDMALATAALLENADGEGTLWTRHDMPQTAPGDRGSFHSLAVFDFNGDGSPDIVTADQEDLLPEGAVPRVFLWENTGGEWTEHVLADVRLGLHDFCTGDVEGDGDVDMVAKVWAPRAWGGNANGNNEHVDFWENLSLVDLDSGVDLEGWTENGGRWEVVDGAIVCQQEPPGSGNGGTLVFEVDDFDDFEMVFDAWPDYGVDTGVYFRMNEEGMGYQLCIDYQPENPMGEIYGEGIGDWDKWSSAWDYTIADASTIAGSPRWFGLDDWSTIWNPGGWNAFRMRVEGNPLHLQVWINGTKTYEYTDPEPLSWTRGTIQLQVHDGVEEWPDGALARFRNLMVSTVVGP